ncbi:hypothetical protein ACWT_5763 [Actinoplanes sp. SE50]|uniref:hypothetical protein n=1 Tax=unclassified Actinoplanes TaxID=2626549 RepID=UPI00023ED678|nr:MULTISPECIES: hypothetical protein [unclassified Actinoplanes]AEV86781.1 hypothetical protein ACPL_5894 [Actinoplanes sp. SE50/110]ATO85178.1 hypothetical protein ACWT_5763 [Actinoplanes sp. SE50]SLM02588.1 hypothetical protein ACSP50_5870 [Actinoplanes sp. SE50/110]
MSLIAVVAGKGSPGATVTSLALTLTWPRDVLLAECDASGGSVLTGYLGGQVPADRGIAQLSVADYHNRLYDAFSQQLRSLTETAPYRLLLPGTTEPGQAAGLSRLWDQLGQYLRDLERSDPPVDVIADCGRVPAPHAPLPLLRHADATLMIVGRTLTAVAAARTRLPQLQAEVGKGGGVLRLLVTGAGDYDAPEIAKHLGVELLAELPEDGRTAGMFTNGTGVPRPSATLLRAANSAAAGLRTLIEQRRAAAAPTPVTPSASREDSYA